METTSLIAWTLLHFLWQGALIAAAFAFAIQALRRSAPSARYAAGVVALALMAVVPLATMARLRGTDARRALFDQASSRVSSNFEDASIKSPTRSRSLGAAIVADAGLSSEPASIVPSPIRAAFTVPPQAREWVEASAPYLVRLWLFGVLMFSVRLLVGWLGTRRLERVGAQPPTELLRERFDRVAASVRGSRGVRLIESAMVQTPAVIGFLRPVLLWPLSLQSGLTVAQIDLLLAHELAHIKRHDYLVNLMQTFLETALFYHPGVWWVSNRVRHERELCCDDVAVSIAGDRRDYAEALLALESWRHQLPILAAGATGGSLLARIQRLVAVEPRASASRPRWAALPLAAAALAGILVSANQAPARTVAPEKATEPSAIQDETGEPRFAVGPARPSAVTRYEGNGLLAARLEWAKKQAAAQSLSSYWVGYTIAARPDGPMIYIDRRTPVSTGDGSIMMGHITFKGADRLKVPGVALEEVVGPRSGDETVVLLGFDGSARHAIERVHVSSSTLPVHFGGRPLLWMDRASDADSLGLIQREFDGSASDNLKEDLVALAGIHTDAPLAFATLRAWLRKAETDRVRGFVVEGLGELPVKEALALLDQVARDDRSREVRREAAEALGEQPAPEATKILAALARTASDKEVAREAAESLGERKDPQAFDELTALAWSDVAIDVRREAVESMGESSSPRGVDELRKIARTHPLEDIRREAIETLGESADAEDAVDTLEAIIKEDRSEAIRSEAVETLAEIGSTRSMKALSNVASSERDADVRRKAIETLWEKGSHAEAMSGLDTMLMSQSSEQASKAVEMLGDLESLEGVQKLASIARTESRLQIQLAAIEALGNAKPGDDAFKALREIAVSRTEERVQRQAVEAMGNLELPGVPAELERMARTHPSEQVRVTAVEAIDHDAQGATDVIRRLVEDAPSTRVREAAVEALNSNFPSEEQAAWLARRLENEAANPAGSRQVQDAILGALEEMGDKGIPFVIQVARTHKDRDIRQRAVEILAESSDPRAKKELARILEK